MMESERLRWLRKNRSKLIVGKYHNLSELNSNGRPKVQTHEKGLSFLYLMLVVVDIWINSISKEWKYAVTLDFLIFLLHLHVTPTDPRCNVILDR